MIPLELNEKYKGVNWGILSEENVKFAPYNFEENNDWIWVLDPLDGTKDFLHLPYTINERKSPTVLYTKIRGGMVFFVFDFNSPLGCIFRLDRNRDRREVRVGRMFTHPKSY